MEKVLDFLEKTHRANWLLFTVCLAFINTFVFYRINGELWNYSVGDHHPFFLFLEISLLATGLTRILVAINFLHWVQLCPIIADVINWLWWERRENLKRFRTKIHECKFSNYEKKVFYDILYSIHIRNILVANRVAMVSILHSLFSNFSLSANEYQKYFNQELFGNKPDDFTVPIYIVRECDKEVFGNGKFYATIALIFALCTVLFCSIYQLH